jgi:hypothetical protein
MEYNIILLIMPPHLLYQPQPLDKAIFGQLKKHLTMEINNVTCTYVLGITNPEWLLSYAQARWVALHEPNIASGF